MVMIEPGTILNMENIRPKGDKISEDKDEMISKLSTLVDELLYDKQQVPAYSDNDFVKWQEYRQEMEEKLAAMTYNYHHAREEVAYWQREAMKNQGRD